MNNTHVMGPTTLNHGESQCVNCKATNREIDLALGPVCPNAPTAPVMTDLAKTLADLAAKATPGPWEVEIDPYGNPFPGITEAGSPFELASFTAGECADENQANAELSVLLHNNLPAIIAALTAQAEHDGLEAENARLREAQILGVGAMMHAAGRLEIIATCPEDQRIVAALLAACRAARAALEAKS